MLNTIDRRLENLKIRHYKTFGEKHQEKKKKYRKHLREIWGRVKSSWIYLIRTSEKEMTENKAEAIY